MTSLAFQLDPLFFHIPGGVGTYIRRLVPALAATDPGLSITLFHSRLRGGSSSPEPWMHPFAREELAEGIRTLYPRWSLTGRPALPASLASKDLIHAPSVVAVPPAGRAQKLVVTVHDVAFLVVPSCFPMRWRAVYRLGLRAAVRRADAIITPSNHTANDLIARTSVEPSRIHVIPLAGGVYELAADPESVMARLDLPRPYLLYVGTIEPRKNLVRLVQAYKRVAAQGVPHALVLAGPRGWRNEELLGEIALAGPGRVVLTGALPPSDLDAVYRQAVAFVYPALYEGFGLPVLEALARGIPTICSTTSSLPEVAGESAFGVDPESVESIAGAIERVLHDPALAGRLAEAGRERARQFSWEKTARLTLEVYEHALDRLDNPGP
jgi:glycosyltransferase involved in cell wall biosynthesis